MSPWLGLDRLFYFLARWVLRSLTKANCLPESLEELGVDTDKPVVFVFRDASVANLLVTEKESLRLGLGSPLAALSLGDNQLRHASFHLYRRRALVGRERLSTNPARLLKLVEALENDPAMDVQLLPVSVFWGRSPDKENSLWRIMFSDNWSPPGFIKKFFMILTQGRQLFIQFSSPMSLRQLVDDTADRERVARKAQRILRVHFRRQHEAAIGPDLSHRRILSNAIVDSVSVREAIQETAREENTTDEKMAARARRYALEIAADYSHTVIRFLEVVLNWVWNRLYDGIRLYNMDKLRQVAHDHEVIYVPCHRSHIDYLLLSFVVYRNNLVPPHIAAGINLNLPVVGTILRRGGAFFMRRSFKGNRLYASVFNEYMHTILSRGFSIEYFVEGGRSRSGRMLSPKTGMLAMTLRSYLRDARKPLAFVPVYVGYEKVLEGRSYIGEMHGKEKSKESVFGLIRSSFSFLRSNFGEVHVNFGDPILLSDFLDARAGDWRKDSERNADELPWFKDSVNELGQEIVTRINAAAVVNPVNLLSLAVLATPKHAMDEEQLRQQLDLYAALLETAPYSKAMDVAETRPDAIINYGLENDFIRRVPHSLGDLISTDPVTALQMAYVRNNTLHLFILPGLISALFRHGRSMERPQLNKLVSLLYPFFRTEYFLHWRDDEALQQAIDPILDVLIARGLLTRDGDQLMAPPVHSMAADLLDHLGQTVLQALERFSLTIRILAQHGQQRLTVAELEELAHQTAQRLSLLYEFNSPEFFDRNVLKNFITQLRHFELVWSADNDTLAFDERLMSLDDEACRILNPEVSQAIGRLTRVAVTETETETEAGAAEKQESGH
ncbi:MAG: glycerol-3-phosphate 1-O-acyltransferase PlsB [Alcanivoracaceae bacterium]|nr:glycerol-3-phosphate 1-O-acyltransferase PlsB [Alcanivoracaceae bacterium]